MPKTRIQHTELIAYFSRNLFSNCDPVKPVFSLGIFIQNTGAVVARAEEFTWWTRPCLN